MGWGTYQNNPVVVEQGMSFEDAPIADPYGKGGGLIDGELMREYPEAGAKQLEKKSRAVEIKSAPNIAC